MCLINLTDLLRYVYLALYVYLTTDIQVLHLPGQVNTLLRGHV